MNPYVTGFKYEGRFTDMKSFFEDLGRKIGETAETVTNKAGEAVEVQRLRNQIRALERGNERDYAELGKMVYNHYKDGEVVDSEAIGICDAIQNREERIGKYEQQISEVKGDVTCGGCGKSVAKDMAFCPHCGSKVPEQAAAEEGDYADAVKEKVVDMAEKVKEKAEAAAETVKEKAESTVEAMKEKAGTTAENVRDKTEEAADTAKEKTEDAADTIKEKTENAADTVKERTVQAADAVKEKTAEAAGTLKEMAEDAAEAVKEKAKEAEEKIKSMTEE